jgi:hypothetical protein
MVKVQEAKRKLERAFFIVTSYEDYKKKAKQKIEQRVVSKQDLENAVIEEYVLGTYFNLNFFHSPLTGETEFLGIERRLQTNLHDFVSIPAKQQMEMDIQTQNIEVGHTPASIRESLLEKVFEMGDKFAVAARKEYPPGITRALLCAAPATGGRARGGARGRPREQDRTTSLGSTGTAGQGDRRRRRRRWWRRRRRVAAPNWGSIPATAPTT